MFYFLHLNIRKISKNKVREIITVHHSLHLVVEGICTDSLQVNVVIWFFLYYNYETEIKKEKEKSHTKCVQNVYSNHLFWLIVSVII